METDRLLAELKESAHTVRKQAFPDEVLAELLQSVDDTVNSFHINKPFHLEDRAGIVMARAEETLVIRETLNEAANRAGQTAKLTLIAMTPKHQWQLVRDTKLDGGPDIVIDVPEADDQCPATAAMSSRKRRPPESKKTTSTASSISSSGSSASSSDCNTSGSLSPKSKMSPNKAQLLKQKKKAKPEKKTSRDAALAAGGKKRSPGAKLEKRHVNKLLSGEYRKLVTARRVVKRVQKKLRQSGGGKCASNKDDDPKSLSLPSNDSARTVKEKRKQKTAKKRT